MVSIKKEHNSIIRNCFALLFVIVLFFVSGTRVASAATLAVSPSSQSVSVGHTFTVRVVVNTEGQSINAVSGGLTFSNDLLTLTSISKSGSIVSLWAQAPSYSNSSGTASFQGVVLNGYSGAAGTVLTFTFKPKAAGTASIALSKGSSSVLLNDGQGTNVLSNTSGDNVNITAPTTSPTTLKESENSTTPVITLPVVTQTPSVVLPVITDYQTTLLSNNYIVVKGTATPNSTITVVLTHILPNGTTTVTKTPITVSINGTFTYVSDDKGTVGKYSMVIENDSAQTKPVTIVVKNPLSFVLLTWLAAILSVQMPVLFALLIIIVIMWYFWHRNIILKRHLSDAINKIHDIESK